MKNKRKKAPIVCYLRCAANVMPNAKAIEESIAEVSNIAAHKINEPEVAQMMKEHKVTEMMVFAMVFFTFDLRKLFKKGKRISFDMRPETPLPSHMTCPDPRKIQKN